MNQKDLTPKIKSLNGGINVCKRRLNIKKNVLIHYNLVIIQKNWEQYWLVRIKMKKVVSNVRSKVFEEFY